LCIIVQNLIIYKVEPEGKQILQFVKGRALKSSNLQFLKYVMVSLLIAGVDYSIFWFSQLFFSNLLLRLLLSRCVSIIVQYLLVNIKVFECKLPTPKTLPLFIGVVLVNGVILDLLIKWISQFGISQIYAKVICELILYLPNYWLLRHWVFKISDENTLTVA
jgi:putative flippase GtrA